MQIMQLIYDCLHLNQHQYHKSLNYAAYILGGMEQNGGMGTEFDEQSEKEDNQKLKNLLKDIVSAFGYSPQDLIE